MTREVGMPLKNSKGELIKCDCGGIYRWDGSLLLSYPPQYPFRCEKCGDRVNIRAERLFPEQYPELQKKIIMTEEEQKKVFRLYQIHSSLKPGFSCGLCKQVLKISTCNGCPIYCQTFNPD